MKTKDVLAELMAGNHLLVGVYHAGKVEAMQIRDKQSGKMRTAYVTRETILTDGEAPVVASWCPDDFDEEKRAKWLPRFKKGDRIVLRVLSSENVQGFKRYSGSLEPLTD